ncbi:hypothetical protein HRbin19_01180 [bacterium HR19]|nr:hypothetical protein HRbin19_01180 [bacterium HR19]
MLVQAIALIGFLAGGGVITPQLGTFDLGGFVYFSMFDSNKTETIKNPLSSLGISARFGYSFLDELFSYVFVGVRNMPPIDYFPTLNQFGVGAKISFLSKERDVNINLDSHIEISPFLRDTKKVFPNNIFWQITPTMSFRTQFYLVYVGVGYKDFMIKMQNGEILRSRKESNFFVVVGGDYYLNPQTYLTLELHSFGQSFITGGISHRF